MVLVKAIEKISITAWVIAKTVTTHEIKPIVSLNVFARRKVQPSACAGLFIFQMKTNKKESMDFEDSGDRRYI